MPPPRISRHRQPKPPLPPRARELAELMAEGLSLQEAGTRMGIRKPTWRTYFRLPLFGSYRAQCIADIRSGEEGRNLKVAATLRDEGAKESSAAHRRVAIEAMRFIEARDGPASVNVNVGLGVNIAPGYLVDVSPHAEAGRRILATARSTRSLQDDGADSPAAVIEHDGAETAATPRPAPPASARPAFGRAPFEEFPPRDSRRRHANENTDALETPGEHSGPG